MPQRCSLISLLAATVAFGGCHHTRAAPSAECRTRTAGVPGVEIALASTREQRASSPSGEQLVVRVQAGAADRAPLAGATVAIAIADGGADSGKVVTWRSMPASGMATLDSLEARRYEVIGRRVGFFAVRQALTVRAGFADTVTLRLAGSAFCLWEVSPTELSNVR